MDYLLEDMLTVSPRQTCTPSATSSSAGLPELHGFPSSTLSPFLQPHYTSSNHKRYVGYSFLGRRICERDAGRADYAGEEGRGIGFAAKRLRDETGVTGRRNAT
jgi:hypothetical protein